MTEEDYSRIEKYRKRRAQAQETASPYAYSNMHTYAFYRKRRHERRWRPAYLVARRRHWLQILTSALGVALLLGAGLFVLGQDQHTKSPERSDDQSISKQASSTSSTEQSSGTSQLSASQTTATPVFTKLSMTQQRNILKEWALDYAKQVGHFGIDDEGNLIPYRPLPVSQVKLTEIHNGFELTTPAFGKLNPQQLEAGKTMADIYSDLPDWSYRIIDQHNGRWELWQSTSGVQVEPDTIVTDEDLVQRYVN